MTGVAAFLGPLLFAPVVLMQCLPFPEMHTAWVVVVSALGLLAATAGAAILLSGRYRSK